MATCLGFLSLVCLVSGPTQAELIGHWTLDDGLADPDTLVSTDSSPNGLDGDLINFLDSPWVANDLAVYGGAVNFEFEAAVVEIPLDELLPIANEPRTLAAWVNVTEMKDGKFLSYGEGRNGAAFDFTVELHDGLPHVWFRHWGGNIRFPGAEEGEFFHFAAVVPDDAEMTSDLRVFINGEESVGVRGAGQDRILDTGLSSLFIGARHPDGTPNPFEGIVDDVWLYNEALDQSEIQQIMNGGAGGATRLQPGDSNQDLRFDQLDIVQVSIAAKYLTGAAATWGDGDWDGAPGGEPGSPPAGNGFFDQIDIITALSAGKYLTGPYAALSGIGDPDDEQTSLIYDPATGQLQVDAPASTQLTSIFVTSADRLFTGDRPSVLDGPFDSFAPDNIFKSTIGSSFGDSSFGNVLPAGLAAADLLADLSASGSLAGGGGIGDVDLIVVPEPSSGLMISFSFAAITLSACYRRRSKTQAEAPASAGAAGRQTIPQQGDQAATEDRILRQVAEFQMS